MAGKRRTIELRCDVGESIGVGHAARCTTLAVALVAAGHRAELVAAELPDWLRHRVDRVGVGWRDHATAGVGGDLVVIDGYRRSEELRALSALGVPTLAIDDNRELPVELASVVLNHNPYADLAMYADIDPSRLLVGSRFTLVRDDVVALRRSPPDVDGRVTLVAIGGTDPLRLTRTIAEHLTERADALTIVSSAIDSDDLTALRALPGVRVDRGDLLDGYAVADLAVIGGGVTMWEVARLGIPAVAAIVADNQRAGAIAAQRLGFLDAIDARGPDGREALLAAVDELLDDRSRRFAMSAAGRGLIDGRGAARVVEAIERTLV